MVEAQVAEIPVNITMNAGHNALFSNQHIAYYNIATKVNINAKYLIIKFIPGLMSPCKHGPNNCKRLFWYAYYTSP
jgi:hypothetical protein